MPGAESCDNGVPARTWQRPGWEISTDRQRLDLDAAHRLIASSYWAAGIPRAVLACALRHSLCFGLYRREPPAAGAAGAPLPRLCGMARVISDYATYAYVADVFIEPEWRRRGLGKWLMECIRAHPHLQELRRWGLVTRDMQALYRHSGFQPLGHPERHMEIYRPGLYRAVADFESLWRRPRQAGQEETR